MNDEQPSFLITIPAEPENVTVVRHAVAGLAENLGMGEQGIGDLKAVITEACMNVVVHAYDEPPGPLQVEVSAADRSLQVIVRDFGSGIRPSTDLDRPSLHIGLPLIAALSNTFEISGGIGMGTEIKVTLPLHGRPTNGVPEDARIGAHGSGAAELTIGMPRLVGPVLNRIVGALSARRQISVDRLSDAALLTDAISQQAPRAFGGDGVSLSVFENDDGINLRIGPMADGSAQQLRDALSVPEAGGSLERLADGLRIDRDDAGEYLVVSFAGELA